MKTTIRMAAWCAAAGRDYNEDNFQLKDNLSMPDWGYIHTDEVVNLEEKGALMVVCDGMGGLNAGEVASKLAVEAIEVCFAPESITPQVLATPDTIMSYIRDSIVTADAMIKEDGKRNREHAGMGSTIVLAWMVGGEVYIGWCGDSRAYRFNPASGLERLSHDHSYVQELVDQNKLLEEHAFDHPDSNIITRSLGDSSKKVRPDVRRFPLCSGDIIMLCSDGLSGVLRDEEIEEIIEKNTDSMELCRKALWNESEKVGWTDNVTITLCQVVSGKEERSRGVEDVEIPNKKKGRWSWFKFVVTLLLGLGLGFGGGYYWVNDLALEGDLRIKYENGVEEGKQEVTFMEVVKEEEKEVTEKEVEKTEGQLYDELFQKMRDLGFTVMFLEEQVDEEVEGYEVTGEVTEWGKVFWFGKRAGEEKMLESDNGG